MPQAAQGRPLSEPSLSILRENLLSGFLAMKGSSLENGISPEAWKPWELALHQALARLYEHDFSLGSHLLLVAWSSVRSPIESSSFIGPYLRGLWSGTAILSQSALIQRDLLHGFLNMAARQTNVVGLIPGFGRFLDIFEIFSRLPTHFRFAGEFYRELADRNIVSAERFATGEYQEIPQDSLLRSGFFRLRPPESTPGYNDSEHQVSAREAAQAFLRRLFFQFRSGALARSLESRQVLDPRPIRWSAASLQRIPRTLETLRARHGILAELERIAFTDEDRFLRDVLNHLLSQRPSGSEPDQGLSPTMMDGFSGDELARMVLEEAGDQFFIQWLSQDRWMNRVIGQNQAAPHGKLILDHIARALLEGKDQSSEFPEVSEGIRNFLTRCQESLPAEVKWAALSEQNRRFGLANFLRGVLPWVAEETSASAVGADPREEPYLGEASRAYQQELFLALGRLKTMMELPVALRKPYSTVVLGWAGPLCGKSLELVRKVFP